MAGRQVDVAALAAYRHAARAELVDDRLDGPFAQWVIRQARLDVELCEECARGGYCGVNALRFGAAADVANALALLKGFLG